MLKLPLTMPSNHLFTSSLDYTEDISIDGDDDNENEEERSSEMIALTNENGTKNNNDLLSNHQKRKKKRFKRMPRFFSIIYYLVLSLVAICLTIATKGTVIWQRQEQASFKGSHSKSLLSKWEFVSLLGYYLAVLITFFVVQGSDPGYITLDEMEWVSEHDGYTPLGNLESDELESHQIDDSHTGIDSPDPSSGQDNEIISTCHHSPLELTDINENHVEMKLLTHRSTLDQKDAKSSFGNDPNDPKNNSIDHWIKPRRKTCRTCHIAPPLRAHHCKICNKCVATFDHHCGFINTCIGERNHCRFYWFLIFQAIGFWKCCHIVNGSHIGIVCFVNYACGKGISFGDLAVVVIARIYLYTLTFAATLMAIVHTWLMLTNGTTFEMEKREHVEYLKGAEMCDLPFSRGLCGNLRLFCCIRDAVGEAMPCSRWKRRRTEKREKFQPILWKPLILVQKDSDDWINNPWQNKYWTCC